MAKTVTSSTLSPYRFAPGLGIFSEDIKSVVEQLNYSAARCPAVHVSLVTDGQGWGSNGSEIPTHLVEFPDDGVQVEVYRFRIWVDADTQDISVGAQCTHAAGQTGDVEFEVGAGGATIGYVATDTTELTGTDATADTGTGWLTVRILVTNTSAVPAAGNTLDCIRIEDEIIAATDLPSPANE